MKKKTVKVADWKKRIGAFAEAIGKTIEEVEKCLTSVVGDPDDEALLLLDDFEATPDNDIKEALKGLSIPSGKINMHLKKLRGKQPVVKTTEVTADVGNVGQALAILPSVPDDASFLEMLKTGGVLKIETTEVLSAVKAALAQSVGLFNLPKLLLDKMEDFAEKQEEPCGKSFYDMQKLLTANKYGDVLTALGMTGKYMSEGRKKKFFERIEERLWPALNNFQTQLNQWMESWMKGANNPAMMVMALTAQNAGGAMPPNMMGPPEASSVIAASEEFINEINRIFAGPGIPVSRALAYDATRIMKILDDKTLPAQIGAANKDQMLKELGINVGSEIVRNEQNITRYSLAIMSLQKVTDDNIPLYLSALVQLGSGITWNSLGNGNSGIGKKL